MFIGSRQLLLKMGDTGTDSYAIRWSKDAASITAGTAVGTIAGLLEVGRQVAAQDSQDLKQPIHFKTRVYKHEVQVEAPATDVRGAHVGVDRPITRYSDAFQIGRASCRERV